MDPSPAVAVAALAISIPLRHFLLTGFANFIYILVSLDVVTSSFEQLNLIRLCNSVNKVARFAISDTVIEDLNLVFPDQVSHGFVAWAGNRNEITRHLTSFDYSELFNKEYPVSLPDQVAFSNNEPII
jgi:hypothetical protein